MADKTISLKLSENEFERLKNLVDESGKNQSEFIRNLIFKKQTKDDDDLTSLSDVGKITILLGSLIKLAVINEGFLRELYLKMFSREDYNDVYEHLKKQGSINAQSAIDILWCESGAEE